MPSLIGNGKLNTSMDMLDSPTVPHGYRQARMGYLNNRKAVFLLGQPDVIEG
jgi:hypothetical protein